VVTGLLVSMKTKLQLAKSVFKKRCTANSPMPF